MLKILAEFKGNCKKLIDNKKKSGKQYVIHRMWD